MTSLYVTVLCGCRGDGNIYHDDDDDGDMMKMMRGFDNYHDHNDRS